MASDLERAFNILSGKQAAYNTLFQYYDGEQPLTYTAKRLEEIFKHLDAYFVENWCSVVIDAARDRINLREIQVMNDKSAHATLQEIYERSEIALESDDVHEAAMVSGEAFLIVWRDQENRPEAYFNDPRLCHVFYDPQYPRIKRYAAKWWTAEDGTMRMTLYYPDRLEYYRSEKEASKVTSAKNLVPDMDVAPEGRANNPEGIVPVFHFRNGQRKIRSDLKNVVPVQNGINKLLTDMMVTAEFAAFPQRYVISNAEGNTKLRNAPNEVWDLPGGDGMGQQTQAGQFPAADLENYLKAIDNMATAISSITRTPKHYFFSVGSNLSGDALIAMESPLNKKAQDRIDRYMPVWRDAAAFLLKLAGQEVPKEQIQVVYDLPESVQPRARAESREINVRAGMPLTTVLREEGWSEARIQQMLTDKDADAARTQKQLATALLDAQRNFDQAEEME